jgi:hypothetical protein
LLLADWKAAGGTPGPVREPLVAEADLAAFSVRWADQLIHGPSCLLSPTVALMTRIQHFRVALRCAENSRIIVL